MNYSQTVLDHFVNPRNSGEIENPDAFGESGSEKCGDITRIYLNIENNIISEARFQTFGCCAAIATSSVTTELIQGKSIEQAMQLTESDIVEALDGLPPDKMHCPAVAEQAVKSALLNYQQKQKKLL